MGTAHKECGHVLFSLNDTLARDILALYSGSVEALKKFL